MFLTERQKSILLDVVDEYIKRACPISSDFLKQECRLDVSPATIRAELAELTREGFLLQPHTSGGRVPTDRGYRFFVDRLFKEDSLLMKWHLQRITELFLEDINDMLRFSHRLAKELAGASSNLGFVFSDDFDVAWKEGWNEVVKAPEFNSHDYLRNFMTLVQYFEDDIGNINFEKGEKIKVYIGKEVPFKVEEFSIVVGRPSSKESKRRPTLAILGPKRMDFKKNISLINSFIEEMEELFSN